MRTPTPVISLTIPFGPGLHTFGSWLRMLWPLRLLWALLLRTRLIGPPLLFGPARLFNGTLWRPEIPASLDDPRPFFCLLPFAFCLDRFFVCP